MTSKYQGKLLNLTDNYLFAGFYDEDDGKVMGKIIKVRGRHGRGTSWKPANRTTAFLLYLLCRETEDNIPYEQLMNLMHQKFADIPSGAIDDVLDWIDQKGALDKEGTNATTNPDPLGLFTGNKIEWEAPALIGPTQPSDFRATHGYSPGYKMITIWK